MIQVYHWSGDRAYLMIFDKSRGYRLYRLYDNTTRDEGYAVEERAVLDFIERNKETVRVLPEEFVWQN